MAFEADGSLKPLMLSDLIRVAQQALQEHGDMPVGVETCVIGYEYTADQSAPVSDEPTVSTPSWLDCYWIGRFKQAFVLDGVAA